MPDAVIGSLRLRGLCPRGLGDAAAVRLEGSLAAMPSALGEAFSALDDVDPGAYWVLRQVRARVSVPASEPDAARQALRVAGALAAAVEAVVRRGPSADAVRFAGRASYVAGYVRARVAGAGVGWVFDRLATLDALGPADALIAAARVVEVDLVDAVADLAGPGGGWERLVLSVPAAEAARLAAALARAAAGHPPDVAALAHLAEFRDAWLADGRWTPALRRGAAVTGLLLVGELARHVPMTGSALAAVWASPAGPLPPDAEGPAAAIGPAEAAHAGPRAPAGGDPATPGPAPGEGPPATSFAAPGTAAFLLLPDLADLLRDAPELARPGAARAGVRARILAGVFGGGLDADDPAVLLAAGIVDRRERAEASEVDGLIAGPLAELAGRLAEDPQLGFVHSADAERFGPDPVLRASNALVRAFARHLHGFGLSSATHLVPRVLPLGGRVTVTPELIEAVLPPPQLQVLLGLAGLDAFACAMPWLAARVLVSHEVEP